MTQEEFQSKWQPIFKDLATNTQKYEIETFPSGYFHNKTKDVHIKFNNNTYEIGFFVNNVDWFPITNQNYWKLGELEKDYIGELK